MSQKPEEFKEKLGTVVTTKLLVICVDRDNDVGEKTGIQTPVVGRDSCIEAAQRLALEDPEDADSNAIFYAIKTYEDLISKGYQAEVVTVGYVKNFLERILEVLDQITWWIERQFLKLWQFFKKILSM